LLAWDEREKRRDFRPAKQNRTEKADRRYGKGEKDSYQAYIRVEDDNEQTMGLDE